MTASDSRIRTLVVDDSAVARQLLVAILQDAGDFEILETVTDGHVAVDRVAKLRPDLVTMDIHLPGLDGLAATTRIMRDTPTPIAIVSGSGNLNDMVVFDALRAGALTAVARPMPPGHPQYLVRRHHLLDELRTAAGARTRIARRETERAQRRSVTSPVESIRTATRRTELVAIAGSTGGPAALEMLLGALPERGLPPILVVQHIAAGFVDGLASWLERSAPGPVRVARDGEPLASGVVLLAPDDYHLTVGPDRHVALQDDEPVGGHKPSANRLFESVANAYGSSAVGIVLSGMGRDGAEGLLALRRAGGLTIAQDRSTSVVFGMPSAALAIDGAQHALPIDAIGRLLGRLIERKPEVRV